ncbi:MAG: PAS domain S-box protein, partial [Promethearchaeota archaeon]
MTKITSLPVVKESFLEVVDSLPLMFFLSQNNRLVYVNSTFCQELGYNKEELLSKTFELYKLIDPTYHEKVRERLRSVITSDTMEVVLVNKDKKKLYCIVSGFLVNFNEKITFLGFITNISEQKGLERQLRESEEKFLEITNNSRDLIYSVNIKGEFIYVNLAVRELLGCTPEEFLGTKFADWLSNNPKNQEELVKHYKILNAGGQPPPLELEVITSLGDIRVFEFRERLVFSEDERLILIHGVGRDITEQKAAETRLRKSEERFRRLARRLKQTNDQLSLSERRYRSLFDKSPLAVLIISYDEPGKIVTVNQKTMELMGYEKQELIGADVTLFLKTEKEKQQFTQKILTLSDVESIGPLEVRWKTKDQRSIFLEVTASRVVEGNIKAIQILGRDITEQKELERALLHLKKELSPQIIFTLYNSGRSGLNILATDPLYFTDDEQTLLLKLGVFCMSSLTQGTTRSTGLFGPLPIAGYPFNFLVYAFNMESKKLVDSRMQGQDYCLLLIMFPKNLQYLLRNRDELKYDIEQSLTVQSINELNMGFLKRIRERIFFKSGG